MKTLLIASRDGSALAPLTKDRCVALLPVAGKPLLVHTIESLAMAAVPEVIIVTEPFQLTKVEKEIGNGARWGMYCDYFPAASSDCLVDVVRQLADGVDDELLLVCADVLRTPIVTEFLAGARMREGSAVTATIGGKRAGLTLVRRGGLTAGVIMNESLGVLGSRVDAPALEFPTARLSRIESLAAFHRANIDAVSGGFPGLILAGRPLVPGVTVGRKTCLTARSVTGRSVFVGSRCRISASAELMDGVVVSDDVVIDRHVTLKSAVIMPNTYIGEFLEVSDAIVEGDTLIHIDDGGVTHVTDPLLLRSMVPGVLGRVGLRAPTERASTTNNNGAICVPSRLRETVEATASGFARALAQVLYSTILPSTDDSTKSGSFAFAFRLRARGLAALFDVFKARRGLPAGSDLDTTIAAQANDWDSIIRPEDAELARNERRHSIRQTINAASSGDETKRIETFVATATREEFRRGEAGAVFRNGKGATQSGKGSNTREAV